MHNKENEFSVKGWESGLGRVMGGRKWKEESLWFNDSITFHLEKVQSEKVYGVREAVIPTSIFRPTCIPWSLYMELCTTA